MSCDKVNGLEEADICRKGDSGRCCRASSEVAQVSILHTQHNKSWSDQYTAHSVTVSDWRAYFAAEGDSRSSGDEDSDARETSEIFFFPPKATRLSAGDVRVYNSLYSCQL